MQSHSVISKKKVKKQFWKIEKTNRRRHAISEIMWH